MNLWDEINEGGAAVDAALDAIEDANTWCAYHNAAEPYVDDAPICGECWHQFQSDQDLVDQHNAEPGIRQAATAADVFACPLCTHDF